MTESIIKLKKEDVETFIQKYIASYRNFLESEYPNRKNEFAFYTGYPFEVKAYVSEKSTLITYKYNAPKLKIEVSEVDEIPDWQPLRKKLDVDFSTNAHLSRIINKPQEEAEKTILDVFQIERYEEQQAELYEQAYHESVESEIEDTVGGYINYLDNAYKVKKETVVGHRNDIYSAVKLVDILEQYRSGFLIAGFETLADVFTELNKDIESSVFLSIHANYRPANTLLRRWLEGTFTALYFDFKLKKYNQTSKKYNKALETRQKWLTQNMHIGFNGNGGVLETLIDTDTDDKATKLLNITHTNNKTAFKSYIQNIYTELNKHVHYSGRISKDPLDDLTFNFVEYNENHFKNWYNKLNQIYEVFNIVILLKFPELIALSKQYKLEYTKFPTLEEKQLFKLKEW